MAGKRIDAGLPAWSGAMPTLANLRWEGGNYTAGEEFARWMAQFKVRGTNASATADPEGDMQLNGYEYAVGSNPASVNNGGALPYPRRSPDGGMEYVYRRRLDAGRRGLVYTVERDTNLLASAWSTNGTGEVGSSIIDAEFESVTNRLAGGDVTFGRLDITLTH